MDIFEPLAKLAQYGVVGVAIVAIVSPLFVLLKAQSGSNALLKQISKENNEYNQRKDTAMMENIEKITRMFTEVVVVHLTEEKEAIKDLILSNQNSVKSNENMGKVLDRALVSLDRLLAVYDYRKSD